MAAVGLIVLLAACTACAQHDPAVPKSLDRMSGPEILRCAASPNCEYDSWDLATTLRKQSSVEKLIAMYPHETSQAQQIIVIALAKDNGAPVIDLMRRAAFTGLRPGMTDMDNHYIALQYLADRCDPDALRELNRDANFRDSYPVGCMWWEGTLEDFGKCSYRPALHHLARSLNSACVNNTEAAQKSLRHLMPKSQCWKKAGLNADFQAETACYLKEMRFPAEN